MITVYPTEGYNSFISVIDASGYFQDRLNSEAWDGADQAKALMTAFKSISTLDITIDLTDSAALQSIKDAQCEQALHELKHDSDSQAVTGIGLAGLLNVKFPADKNPPPRFSPRALSILRPYLTARTITRTR